VSYSLLKNCGPYFRFEWPPPVRGSSRAVATLFGSAFFLSSGLRESAFSLRTWGLWTSFPPATPPALAWKINPLPLSVGCFFQIAVKGWGFFGLCAPLVLILRCVLPFFSEFPSPTHSSLSPPRYPAFEGIKTKLFSLPPLGYAWETRSRPNGPHHADLSSHQRYIAFLPLPQNVFPPRQNPPLGVLPPRRPFTQASRAVGSLPLSGPAKTSPSRGAAPLMERAFSCTLTGT